MKKSFSLSVIIFLGSLSFLQAQDLSIPISCVKSAWGWNTTFTYDVATPNPTSGVGCSASTVSKVDITGWIGSFGVADFPVIADWTLYDRMELLLYTDADGVAFDDSVSYKGYDPIGLSNVQVYVANSIETSGIPALNWVIKTISLTGDLVNSANSAITYTSLSDPNLGLTTINFFKVLLPVETASVYVGGITLKNKNGTELSSMNKAEIVIYPNPVVDILKIVSENEVKQVEIINSLGIVVLVAEGSNSISVSNLPNGVYLLKAITVDNNVLINNFIKK